MSLSDFQRSHAAPTLFERPLVPAHSTPNWQSYWLAARADAPISRDQIMQELYARGIATRRGVMASRLEPAYAQHGVALPHTEDFVRRGLMLPMHSRLNADQQQRVLEGIAETTDTIMSQPR